MSHNGNKKQNHLLLEFRGVPQEAHNPKELSRWKRFLRWINPAYRGGRRIFKKIETVAENYYQSEANKRNAEAEKFQAEAAKLAAEAEFQKAKTLQAVNDEIKRIFSDEDVPNSARLLQLAQLTSDHPEILEQLDVIQAKVNKLSAVNFTQFFLGDSTTVPVENESTVRSGKDE